MPLKDPEARRAYGRKYYRRWRQEGDAANRAWVGGIKQEQGCADCGGVFHPAAMDFHHRDPATKKFDISAAFTHRRSRTQTLEEIAKCDVLCANCHRVRHYNERQETHDGIEDAADAA